MMNPPTYLIVGASRGIGKSFVTELAVNPSNKVFATVRKPVSDFDSLLNVSTVILDQASTSSVEAAASQITEPIDTLVINAAMGDMEKLLSLSDQRFEEYCNTNIVGPVRVVKAFLPAMKRGRKKQIVLISSLAGSMSVTVDLDFGIQGPYAVSKSALNMIAVQLHNELHKKEGFTVIPLHPGWVSTDMGNIVGDGGMPPAESVAHMIKVIDGLKFDDSAKFWSFNGSVLQW